MSQDYYEKIERFNEGYFENLKVAHTENFFNEQEDFSILLDDGEIIKGFGDFHGVQIGDTVYPHIGLNSLQSNPNNWVNIGISAIDDSWQTRPSPCNRGNFLLKKHILSDSFHLSHR